jgi:chloride channel protein, CIC family
MGAVLAAVVHAPLTSILIVFELTQDYKVMLPAMLACVVATGTARVLFHDSIYTLGLRRRGLQVGSTADSTLLRRLSIEQVVLEPATQVRAGDPMKRIIDLMNESGASDFVVVADGGVYAGMVVAEDIKITMLQPQALPLLTCGDVMRTDLPLMKNTDDLATVLDAFAEHDVSRLPVAVASVPDRAVGLISRTALMRRYHEELNQTS